jgi:uncharacterized protein (TIGR00725 family)
VVYVGVVGAGMPAARPEDLHAAEAVGRAVAAAGGVVVCGGLGGVMEAACRGAREADGVTVGILPGADRAAANPFVTVAVPTGMGELRNGLVVRTSDALVAVGGEWGTLAEIALAVKTDTPVVGLGTWELAKDGFPSDAIVPASDPAEAVATALSLIRA